MGLLLKALQNGYRGVFMPAQDLFDEMYSSLADRSTPRLLNRLTCLDVLVIDEMGYLNLRPEQSNIFFKLMHLRYRRRPTIITTNLDYPEWATFLGVLTPSRTFTTPFSMWNGSAEQKRTAFREHHSIRPIGAVTEPGLGISRRSTGLSPSNCLSLPNGSIPPIMEHHS